MKTLMLVLCCASLLIVQGNSAALASIQNVRPIGVILTIDSAAKRITIKTDAGPGISITFEEATRFLRVAPGAKDLENAAILAVSDLAVGDRILVRGKSASDHGSFVAASIIVMSKGDIAKKYAAERAEWEKRGVGGVITALNPAAKEITINVPSTTGAKPMGPMVIAFASGAALRRYAPNSVKFGDALPSSFEELKIGDQVKALGTSNEDRSRFTAEELVAGSFRTIAATVVALDAAQNTIQITDLANNKRMQAQVTADSTVRRLSAEVAQLMATRIKGGSSPAATPAPQDSESSRQQSPRDLQSMIEKLSPLSLASLKPGDALIISCTNSDDPSRVTAITLLAGAEPVSKQPYLNQSDVAPGTFIAAVGADNEEKQELDPGLIAASKVVVDSLDQCAVIGDLKLALKQGLMTKTDIHSELGEVIAGRKPGRENQEEVIVFDSTGTALQDVAAAAIAYEKAVAAGRCMILDFAA